MKLRQLALALCLSAATISGSEAGPYQDMLKAYEDLECCYKKNASKDEIEGKIDGLYNILRGGEGGRGLRCDPEPTEKQKRNIAKTLFVASALDSRRISESLTKLLAENWTIIPKAKSNEMRKFLNHFANLAVIFLSGKSTNPEEIRDALSVMRVSLDGDLDLMLQMLSLSSEERAAASEMVQNLEAVLGGPIATVEDILARSYVRDARSDSEDLLPSAAESVEIVQPVAVVVPKEVDVKASVLAVPEAKEIQKVEEPPKKKAPPPIKPRPPRKDILADEGKPLSREDQLKKIRENLSYMLKGRQGKPLEIPKKAVSGNLKERQAMLLAGGIGGPKADPKPDAVKDVTKPGKLNMGNLGGLAGIGGRQGNGAPELVEVVPVVADSAEQAVVFDGAPPPPPPPPPPPSFPAFGGAPPPPPPPPPLGSTPPRPKVAGADKAQENPITPGKSREELAANAAKDGKGFGVGVDALKGVKLRRTEKVEEAQVKDDEGADKHLGENRAKLKTAVAAQVDEKLEQKTQELQDIVGRLDGWLIQGKRINQISGFWAEAASTEKLVIEYIQKVDQKKDKKLDETKGKLEAIQRELRELIAKELKGRPQCPNAKLLKEQEMGVLITSVEREQVSLKKEFNPKWKSSPLEKKKVELDSWKLKLPAVDEVTKTRDALKPFERNYEENLETFKKITSRLDLIRQGLVRDKIIPRDPKRDPEEIPDDFAIKDVDAERQKRIAEREAAELRAKNAALNEGIEKFRVNDGDLIESDAEDEWDDQ